MTSSNGNIFCVTGPLCGEFTGRRWIPRTKASDALMFSLICAWTNVWANNRGAGDLRRHRAHCDVIVIKDFDSHNSCKYQTKFSHYRSVPVVISGCGEAICVKLCNYYKQWGRQSNASNKSIKTAPVLWSSSKADMISSISFSKNNWQSLRFRKHVK